MLEAEKQQFEEVVQELKMEQEQIKRWWWCLGAGGRGEGAPRLDHVGPMFPVRLERPPPGRSSLLDDLVWICPPNAPGLGVCPEKAVDPTPMGPFCTLEHEAWAGAIRNPHEQRPPPASVKPPLPGADRSGWSGGAIGQNPQHSLSFLHSLFIFWLMMSVPWDL